MLQGLPGFAKFNTTKEEADIAFTHWDKTEKQCFEDYAKEKNSQWEDFTKSRQALIDQCLDVKNRKDRFYSRLCYPTNAQRNGPTVVLTLPSPMALIPIELHPLIDHIYELGIGYLEHTYEIDQEQMLVLRSCVVFYNDKANLNKESISISLYRLPFANINECYRTQNINQALFLYWVGGKYPKQLDKVIQIPTPSSGNLPFQTERYYDSTISSLINNKLPQRQLLCEADITQCKIQLMEMIEQSKLSINREFIVFFQDKLSTHSQWEEIDSRLGFATACCSLMSNQKSLSLLSTIVDSKRILADLLTLNFSTQPLKEVCEDQFKKYHHEVELLKRNLREHGPDFSRVQSVLSGLQSCLTRWQQIPLQQLQNVSSDAAKSDTKRSSKSQQLNAEAASKQGLYKRSPSPVRISIDEERGDDQYAEACIKQKRGLHADAELLFTKAHRSYQKALVSTPTRKKELEDCINLCQTGIAVCEEALQQNQALNPSSSTVPK